MPLRMFTGAGKACRYKGCDCCEADVFGGAEEDRDESPGVFFMSRCSTGPVWNRGDRGL